MNDDSRIEDLKVSLNDLSDSLYDKMDGIQDRIDDIQDRSGDDYNELRERLELLETRMAALEERNAHTDSERWDQKAEAELAKDIAAIQNKEEDIMADVEVLKEQMKSLRAGKCGFAHSWLAQLTHCHRNLCKVCCKFHC